MNNPNITWAVAVSRGIDLNSANFLKKDIDIDSTFQLLLTSIDKSIIEVSFERNDNYFPHASYLNLDNSNFKGFYGNS